MASFQRCVRCKKYDVANDVCKNIGEKCFYEKLTSRKYYGRKKAMCTDLLGNKIYEDDEEVNK